MKTRPKPIAFDLDKDGITQSLLGSWVKCRRLGKFLLQGWELPLSKEAAAFGSLYHALLATAYDAIRETGSVPAFMDVSDDWLKINAGRIVDMQSCEVMLAKAFALWEPYWAYWWKDVKEAQWMAAESQFDVRWKGYRLRGMRDGIFLVKGTPTLLETKTKSRIDVPGILTMLPMDWQNQFYLTASRAEGIPVRHVLYNVIRRPALIQGRSESLPKYQERMKNSVSADPEKYFIRFEASYSDKSLADFEIELLTKLCDFEHWLANPEFTYPNQQVCQGFWNCEFMEACSSGDFIGYTKSRQLFRELE